MMDITTQQKLADRMAELHPQWDRSAIEHEARETLACLDHRLLDPLRRYLDRREETDFRSGQFSVFMILALRRSCTYLDALLLMDLYLKDPATGTARILGR